MLANSWCLRKSPTTAPQIRPLVDAMLSSHLWNTWLVKSAPLLGQAGEAKKYVTALDQLAGLAHRAGEVADARKLLEQAVTVCDQAELKDEKRALAKRLEGLASA